MALGLGMPCAKCCKKQCQCRCALGSADTYGKVAWSDSDYPPDQYCGTNPCCPDQCLPCRLTIAFTPGTRWVNASSLSAADKSELTSFFTRTFVTELYPPGVSLDRAIYFYIGSQWQADASFSSGGGDNCSSSAYWQSGYPPDYDFVAGSPSASYQGEDAIFTRQSSSPVLTLSSGKKLQSAYFSLGWKYGPGFSAPFSYSEWCGASSFSRTFSTPNRTTGIRAGVNEVVIQSAGAFPTVTTMYLDDNSATLSW